MRIIAGSAKGRRLKGPSARRHSDRALGIRPSSDMVRGAVFSSLESLGADFTRVLDLYAGTGALGIEALSRGAEWCDFVEKDRVMAEVVKENLAIAGFDDAGKVYPIPAGRSLERLEGRYTLVVADPPYADQAAWEVLERLALSNLVDSETTTIVVEHSAGDEPRVNLAEFHLEKVLRHGDTAVSIYLPGRPRGIR